MKTRTDTRAIPHPMAIGSFAVSVVAIALALIGTFGVVSPSPFFVHPDSLARKPFALVIGLCYVLPIFLGIGAALFAGQAMTLIEDSDGKYRADGPAFFAIMIGLLAAVVGLVDCFALSQFS